MLTDGQRRALLTIAWKSVSAAVAGGQLAVLPPSNFPYASGVFVTLKHHGRLQGCLGTLECLQDLGQEVIRCAADAARSDPRFSPVTAEQLPGLSVEISVLGPLEPIDFDRPLSECLAIGRHGLVIERGRRRGVLLPQVATERQWTAEQFVQQTCIKAGLDPDAFRHGAAVYRFEAEVFGVESPAADYGA
jgi:AmmeMemoRadiSam system protein A